MNLFARNSGVKNKLHPWVLAAALAVSLALHFPIFKYDLVGYHVWRQTQTQTVIENFCKEDFQIFNPRLNNLAYPDRIMRMEFPLYQWIAAGFCKITGQPVLTTRVVTFVIGLLTVWGFYLFMSRLFGNRLLASLGAWAFSFSPVFYYYTMNPLPDNLALCFGVFALHYFTRYVQLNARRDLIAYGIMLCLATLCKLPFILFAVPFGVYWLGSGRRKLADSLWLGGLMLPAIVWYVSVIGSWRDNGVLLGVAGGGFDLLTYLDYVQHNFISTLPELYINFAALLLFFSGAYFVIRKRVLHREPLAKYLFAGLLSVIAFTLFELNMIAKVHDYYLFPFLPYLFVISLYGFRELAGKESRFAKYLALLCIVIMPLTAYLRSHTRWNLQEPGFNASLLAYKKQIQATIPDSAVCLAGNDQSGMIFLYHINRKGYTFAFDALDVRALNEFIEKKVSYVISDAHLGDETNRLFGKPIAEFGDIKIFKL